MTKKLDQPPRLGRRPGSDGEVVRLALLETARRMFAERGYQAVSVRALAAEAGVNPAMIHYYFGNKEGLYLAVLREVLAPTLERLAGLTTASRQDRKALAELIHGHMQLLQSNRWLMPLVAREVLLREGPLQEAFADQLASRVFSGLRSLTAETPTAQAGRPEFAVLSVLAMTLFPFLAKAILERVLGLKTDDAFSTVWSEHVAELIFSNPATTDADPPPYNNARSER